MAPFSVPNPFVPQWGQFPDPLRTEDVDDHQKWLVAPFRFIDRDGNAWEAPAGMVYDGCSIPTALWSVFRESPYTGAAHRPAVVHDAGCKGIVRFNGLARHPGGFRDGGVHAAFYAGIRARGGSPFKAWSFYRAVWSVGMAKGGHSPRSKLDRSYEYSR